MVSDRQTKSLRNPYTTLSTIISTTFGQNEEPLLLDLLLHFLGLALELLDLTLELALCFCIGAATATFRDPLASIPPSIVAHGNTFDSQNIIPHVCVADYSSPSSSQSSSLTSACLFSRGDNRCNAYASLVISLDNSRARE